MDSFWKTVAGELARGHRVFVALVVAHTRHSPGTTGARLWVSDDGRRDGTIGGGIMERRVVDQAREDLAAGRVRCACHVLHHRASGPGERSGMICAGAQTNLYLVCRPETEGPVLHQFLDRCAAGEDVALTLSPEGMGLRAPFGLPPLERAVFEPGETDWQYSERGFNPRRVAILGGGHCGLALSRQMHLLGYDVTVFDTRPDLDTMKRNRWAERQIVDDYRVAGTRIAHPEITPVVVLTTDFPSDVRALLGVLDRPFPFVGVMGSAAKLARIRSSLREEGVSAEALARIMAPVGLPIGSHTPAEIAVSIAAQLLAVRRGVREGTA